MKDTSDQWEGVGQQADRIDNCISALEMRISAEAHVRNLRVVLTDVRNDLRALVVEATGERSVGGRVSTPFQSAMHDFLSAREVHLEAVHASDAEIDETARGLAQAGDVLESALRQMIRDEAPGITYAGRAKPDVRFLTYGGEEESQGHPDGGECSPKMPFSPPKGAW